MPAAVNSDAIPEIQCGAPVNTASKTQLFGVDAIPEVQFTDSHHFKKQKKLSKHQMYKLSFDDSDEENSESISASIVLLLQVFAADIAKIPI